MSSPDELWWEMHAGEYVLGTLDAKARELFERILRHDRALQRSVRDWERRLAPLGGTTPAREPPERLWAEIERLRRAEAEGRDPVRADERDAEREDAFDELVEDDTLDAGPLRREPVPVPPVAPIPSRDRAPVPPLASSLPPPDSPPDSPHASRRANPFVALVAALATAASLVLGTLLFEQRQRLEALQGSILQADGVSVILGENGAPLWLVQADFSGERVRVTALAPPPAGGGGDYQLWQILPEGGVSPVALLPEKGGGSATTPVPAPARRPEAFAVSLEPPGGSPGAVPSGAVLYRAEVIYPDETEEESP